MFRGKARRPRRSYGLCDDIDFDHANSRLAMVSESGQVDVFDWLRP